MGGPFNRAADDDEFALFDIKSCFIPAPEAVDGRLPVAHCSAETGWVTSLRFLVDIQNGSACPEAKKGWNHVA